MIVIRNLAAPVVIPRRAPLVMRPMYGAVLQSGTGDMASLLYDPRGIEADVYDGSNLTGNIDGGTFN